MAKIDTCKYSNAEPNDRSKWWLRCSWVEHHIVASSCCAGLVEIGDCTRCKCWEQRETKEE